MATVLGNSKSNVLSGGNDKDVIIGKGGNDVISAGNAGSVLIGDGSSKSQVKVDNVTIKQDVVAKIHFDGSGAWFQNTVGAYVYDDAGNITSTKIIYGDVSHLGASLGAADLSVPLKAGEHIGFFVAPNAAGQTDMAKLIGEGGTFHLVNCSNGVAGNVNSGEPLQLAYESPDHQWSVVHTNYWTDLFTTSSGNNRDGFNHAKITVDATTGQMHVAMEDLMNGGDQNFADANFSLDIGKANAQQIAHNAGSHSGTGVTSNTSHDDTLNGGAGDDVVFGMVGNDTINGGLGHNTIYAGSGNDHIIAGGGNDDIVGGAGFDTVDFAAATSGVTVNLNAHKASGFGTDTIWGVEAIKGSAFNDTLTGDKGNNVIDGGAGSDVIRGGKGADILTGGAGDDRFVYGLKDVGTGVDHITDFGNGRDALDLRALFKGNAASNAGNVKITDAADGSHVFAKIGGSFQEVAVLDGYHGHSVNELMKSGMLLL